MEQATTEFLAAMFGAYWGVGIKNDCDNAPFYFKGVRSVNGSVKPQIYGDWSGGTNPQTAQVSWDKWDNCKPILTPLSKITDEDAIEVAKIVFGTAWESCDINISILPICKNGTFLEILFTTELNDTQKKIHAIDYLRSRGYDCGFRHITSLIDAGLAVKAETKHV